MTDKELQKLGRRELLQLLLEQAQETEQLRQGMAAAGERAREMDATFERLRERLNEKDAQIREMGETYDRLRDRLNEKDAQIEALNAQLQEEREEGITGLSEMGSIAEAALRLNGVFDAAQRAANQYLHSIQEMYPAPEGVEVPPMYLTEEEVEAAAAAPVQPPPPQPQAESRAPAEKSAAPEKKREEAPRKTLRVKKQQEKGKLTLFFGWQHD